MREPFARCLVHPTIVCEHSMEEDFHRGHVNPLVRTYAVLRCAAPPPGAPKNIGQHFQTKSAPDLSSIVVGKEIRKRQVS